MSSFQVALDFTNSNNFSDFKTRNYFAKFCWKIQALIEWLDMYVSRMILPKTSELRVFLSKIPILSRNLDSKSNKRQVNSINFSLNFFRCLSQHGKDLSKWRWNCQQWPLCRILYLYQQCDLLWRNNLWATSLWSKSWMRTKEAAWQVLWGIYLS